MVNDGVERSTIASIRARTAVLLRRIGFGSTDRRLRATWRVLLAGPFILLTQLVATTVTPMVGLTGMLPTGLFQFGAFVVLLVGWSRVVDRRTLRGYGFSVSARWVLELAVAFVAVVFAHLVWYGIGTWLGWTTLAVASPSAGGWGMLAVGLGTAFVAIAVNVVVQDTVYFGIVLQNAAEGFATRGLTARRAAVGGWLVSVAFFAGIHSDTMGRLLGLGVAGGLFGLLYLHTGELALPVGFHLGVNFTGGWLFVPAAIAPDRPAVVAVSEALPALDAVSGPRIPQMAIAYLAIVAVLIWRRDGLPIESGIARWNDDAR